MGASENKDVVNRIYQAFGSGDVPTVLDSCADDVEWVDNSPEISGIRCNVRGKDGVSGYFTKLPEAIDVNKFEVTQLLAEGDTVVAIIDIGITAKSSGKSVENNNVHVFTMRDGKVARWEGFAAEDASVFQ